MVNAPESRLEIPVDSGAPLREDDRFAAALRGFGPLGLLAILVIVLSGNVFVGRVAIPLGGILVLLWAYWSHTPLHAIGYVRPKSWVGTIATGLALGVVLKFLMKAIVMPLFGADPINQTYHYLAGNTAALPAAIWTMIAAAGFGEETVFRGFAFERLGKLLGSSSWATTITVMLTAAWFGAAHYADQGLAGVEQATVVGLVLGATYALTRRIWLVIVAHIAFDLTALAIIYWDLESAAAHLIFK